VSFNEQQGITVISLPMFGSTYKLRFLFSLIVLMLSWFVVAANADEPPSMTMKDVQGGELLLRTNEAGKYVPALMLNTDVQIGVSGMIASVEVKQHFRNPAGDWVHGVYAFPLPENAAVNGMRIEVDGRIIVGEIHEKKRAKQKFEAARKAGKKAALVEQQRPNMFRSSVANIPPGEQVTVTLNYTQKVRYENDRFSLRFPMTITPRYIPGVPLPYAESLDLVADHGWAVGTDQVPDAAQITPFLEPRLPAPGAPVNKIDLRVELNPGLSLADVSSTYHPVHVARHKDVYQVALSAPETSMDRDFELTWKPGRSSVPQAALFTEKKGEHHYAMLMVMPPEQSPDTTIPREVIFVIDRSGSMSGVSIDQARDALQFGLGQLGQADRFNIIQFDDRPQALFSSAQPVADAAAMQRAQQFVRNLTIGGGTEISSALEMALRTDAEASAGLLRQVVFITDGAVGNEEALFAQIRRDLGRSRLFTVGIGSAPNSYFMRKAAEFGRGTFTYIGNLNEVTGKMSELFTRLSTPTLRDIEMEWPVDAEVFPNPVPDLYAGQPLVVTAKLDGFKGKLRIFGTTASSDWERSMRLRSKEHSSGVATLWARDKIDWWDQQIALHGEGEESRQGILDIALEHQLMSRYTSFLAVEDKPSRPTGNEPKTSNVLNARPAGQGPQPFAYPQTATDGPAALLSGVIALFSWLYINVLRRRWNGERY